MLHGTEGVIFSALSRQECPQKLDTLTWDGVNEINALHRTLDQSEVPCK